MSEVSVIIVSYNTRDLTLKAIGSLIDHTSMHLKLYVIDNASDDGSAEAIAATFPDVPLIRSSVNLGFAGANNAVARLADTAYLLLLNPDTETLEGAVDELLEFAKANPAAGIWGGRTVFSDGSPNDTSCWNRMTVWSLLCLASGLSSIFPRSRLFNPEYVPVSRCDRAISVDIVTGCFFMIRRDLWCQLDGFAPEFFMYGEEADLCLRARALGAKPMVTRHAVIVHHGGASERVAEDKLVRLLEAKTRLVRRHWTGVAVPCGLLLLCAWPASRAAACSVLGWVRPHWGERARVWRAVWRRRSKWRVGGDTSVYVGERSA